MDRSELLERLAEHYGVDSMDTNSYDWQCGCYVNGVWLSLAEIVKCLED